jgi:hypothetical protein
MTYFVRYLPITTGNSTRLDIDGKDHCADLYDDLRSAKRFVFLTGLHFMADFSLIRTGKPIDEGPRWSGSRGSSVSESADDRLGNLRRRPGRSRDPVARREPRQVEPLVDPAVALGSRNAVSAEVRTLIGAVTETPPRPARDVISQDMADHPARSSCRWAIRTLGEPLPQQLPRRSPA